MTARALSRHGLGIVRLLLASVAVMVALLAPWLAPHDPITSDFSADLRPPGTPGHLFGSRVLYGARLALFIGFCTVLLTALVGGLLGLLAGFLGGWPGTILMRVVDVQLSSPSSSWRSPSTPSSGSGCATSSSVCQRPAGLCTLAWSEGRCGR